VARRMTLAKREIAVFWLEGFITYFILPVACQR